MNGKNTPQKFNNLPAKRNTNTTNAVEISNGKFSAFGKSADTMALGGLGIAAFVAGGKASNPNTRAALNITGTALTVAAIINALNK